MNKVILLGRVCQDLELKQTQSNKNYTRFSLAVNRRGKDAGTDFISCLAWDKTAEVMQKHLKKGSQIGIVGHIQTGQYDDKYAKRVYTTDVIVEEFYFADSKPTQQSENQESIISQPITDNDFPF